MSLDDRQIALVRESFEEMKPNLEDASVAFYERLFEIEPRLRPLFRDNIHDQGMRFMAAVGTILDQLDEPGGGTETTTRLGEGHAALGIRPGDFKPMRIALIDTFRSTLGARFTEDHAEAWGRAYDEIADAMVRAGGGNADTADR